MFEPKKYDNSFTSRLFRNSLSAVALLASVNTYATNTPNVATADLDTSSSQSPRTFTLFGGAGAGYGLVNGSDYASAPSGLHSLFSLSAATQIRKWEFESGVSWFYSALNGEKSAGQAIAIRTRAGTFDLGARYRLGSRFQLGPTLNLAYGTDTGFGPSVGAAQTSVLLGGRALYELPLHVTPVVRLWSQISTDVSSGNRNFWVALTGIQVGLPVLNSHKPERADDVLRVSSAAPREVAASGSEVRWVMDERKVYFKTNSGTLKPLIANLLGEVGKYLKETSNDVRVAISGHADRRGSYGLNMKLSRKRAESVRQALVNGGAGTAISKTTAYSYLVPTDPRNVPEAWAKNRRVEIVFENVKDPEGLRKHLRKLEAEAPTGELK